MKTHKSWFIFLLFVQLLNVLPALHGQTLVAEVYPGAEIYKHQAENPPNTSVDMFHSSAIHPAINVAYLSKDPLDKVRDFYKDKYGELVHKVLYNRNLVDANKPFPYVLSKNLLDAQAIYSIKQDIKTVYPCGIQLIENDPKENSVEFNMRGTVRSIFLIHLERQLRLGNKTQADYDAVKQKYQHLFTAFFQLTDAKFEGMHMTQDMIIYQKYAQEVEKNRFLDRSQLANEHYQNRIKEGITHEVAQKEAAALLETTFNEWDAWVDCLEEMSQAAYRTLIIIGKHPTNWDLDSTNENH